jgi:hypothetical protein
VVDRRALASVPLVLVVGVALFAGWMLVDAGDDPVPPVAVAADGPRFDTVEEMAAASDVVVRGDVVAVEEGRAITDPERPDVGIVTRLLEIRVAATLRGPRHDTIVVEQEAALLDGTPIVVNGLPPVSVGTEAVWFLLEGDGGEFPYAALINEQGLIPFDGGAPEAAEPSGG